MPPIKRLQTDARRRPQPSPLQRQLTAELQSGQDLGQSFRALTRATGFDFFGEERRIRPGMETMSRSQAIDLVGGFAGPVKGPGALRLRISGGAVEKGGQALKFNILDDIGNSVTDLEIFINKAETKGFIESIGDIGKGELKNQLGRRAMGGLLNQIKAMFPKLEELAGQRTGGTRINPGTAKAAKSNPLDFGEQLTGLTEQGPLARVKIGKAQAKEALDSSLDFARLQRTEIDGMLANERFRETLRETRRLLAREKP